MAEQQEIDTKSKVMLLGESQTGKTSFIQRYVKNNFSLGYITTVGIDFQVKILTLKDKNIKLQIWDTAGQERFKNITKNYFQSSDGFIVAYDITSRNSFVNVSTWLKEITNNAPEDTKKILIGTKCDLTNREVSTEEGQNLASENKMQFFETSAKNDINVKETFEAIALEIMQSQENNESQSRNSLVIDRETAKESEKKNQQKKKCC